MTPRTTVVILNWNGERYTIPCVQSVKDAGYADLSIVVCDNGSRPESLAAIRAEHPDIVILENGRNCGFGAGNNPGIVYGLEQGSGYIWLLNNDTLVSPETLPALLAMVESDAQFSCVGSVFFSMDNPKHLQAWGGGRINLWTGLEAPIKDRTEEDRLDYITAASVLLSAQALRHVGLFDENFFMYWEDADLGFRLRECGYRMSVAAEAHVLHAENASTKDNAARMALIFHESAVRFLRKHARVPLVPIVISATLRIGHRLLRGQFSVAKQIFRGVIHGLRQPAPSRNVHSE